MPRDLNKPNKLDKLEQANPSRRQEK